MNKKNLEKNDLNLHALFIGDKAENGQLYKEMLINLVDEHLGWRQNYMPQDRPVITPQEKKFRKIHKNGKSYE